MALSKAFVAAHIAKWQAELKSASYPHREKWPSRLFHHAPIENAVQILRSGQLLSRNDSGDIRTRDVAAVGVIDASHRAHRYVRLYFRPRTPTQYHIEGIRRPADCRFGPQAHAPILVMFVFAAEPVLVAPDVRFSDENMQTGVVEGDTEAYFNDIPFLKVFHEGGTGGDASITKHRCAEVLPASPMNLDGTLQWIYCRSEAEKAFLIHLLGADAVRWLPRILVSDDLRVFEKTFPFVESVSISKTGVIFALNPRRDHQPLSVRVSAWTADGAAVVNFFRPDLSARPPTGGNWRVSHDFAPGRYRVEIEVDAHLAYRSYLVLDEHPF